MSCEKGHNLRLIELGEIKRRQHVKGHIYKSDGRGVQCDICGMRMYLQKTGGYFSCEEVCDYDLCPNCFFKASNQEM